MNPEKSGAYNNTCPSPQDLVDKLKRLAGARQAADFLAFGEVWFQPTVMVKLLDPKSVSWGAQVLG